MKQTGSLVSVIIPVYNGKAFLADAVGSVLAQAHRPLEIIVVDDGSTDETARVAAGLGRLVRCLRQPNLGPAAARNAGLQAALGSFIAFLSHDDIWTPDKLTVQLDALREHPEALYSVARVRFFLEPGCAIPPGFRPELLQGDHLGRIPETLVAHRSAFDVVGFFDATMDSCEDVDWFARAGDLGVPMIAVERTLLLKRVHDANLSLTAPTADTSLLRALNQSIRRKRAASLDRHD